MPRYSPERKAALLKKLLPPLNLSVAELARQEGISEMTLYAWRKQAKAGGAAVPGDKKLPDDWPAEAKFAVVLETATLSEIELSEYCRSKGLYPKQVNAWREACIQGQQTAQATKQSDREQARADKKRIRELERELRRKDKALAEAAAILVLRKKPQCLLGRRQRGQLTSLPERQQFVNWLNEGVAAGARKAVACEELGVSLRTLQRWTEEDVMRADARTTTERPVPRNALSPAERDAILALCNSPEHAHLPPSQIVPRLADQGCYLASEATFYRVLRAADQQHRRGRSQPPRKLIAPTSHVASAANQVWSWDITYLPSPVRGQYYYLYLIEDIYSRKGVGWEVYGQESGELAAKLLQRSVISEQCLRQPLVLHSDNGAPMKSATLLSKMYDLGVTPSRGRPRVSNDNPYSESLFRTLKYCPQWPQDGFADLDAARAWVRDFMRWYNHEHRHSRIRFVTPAERHRDMDHQVLARRHALYQQARARTPERWSGKTRNWEPIGAVMLNPDREQPQQKEAA
ncbi:MAG: IS3 family transposase [Gammaproteobacteria bacterium]